MKWLLSSVLTIIAILGYAAARPPEGKAARRVVIVKSPRGEAAFTPPAVTCWAGDQLTWENLTTADHYPGVLNKDGSFVGFFPAALKPGAVSQVFSPGAELDKDNKQVPYTIHYLCALHRNEQGTIHVNATP